MPNKSKIMEVLKNKVSKPKAANGNAIKYGSVFFKITVFICFGFYPFIDPFHDFVENSLQTILVFLILLSLMKVAIFFKLSEAFCLLQLAKIIRRTTNFVKYVFILFQFISMPKFYLIHISAGIPIFKLPSFFTFTFTA